MFGLIDEKEEQLDRLLDGGVEIKVTTPRADREAQSLLPGFERQAPIGTALEPKVRVWCHATPEVQARLKLRGRHWHGDGQSLRHALAVALHDYWVR